MWAEPEEDTDTDTDTTKIKDGSDFHTNATFPMRVWSLPLAKMNDPFRYSFTSM